MSDTTVTRVKLDDLEPYPGNPRKRQNVDDIKASLERFGQYRTIVVQESRMRILAGHHVAQAAGELGWDEINVELIDCDDEQARAIVLADNRLSDLASYERTSLAELLEAADREGGLLGTGYDGKDLRKMLRATRAGDRRDDLGPDERSSSSKTTVELGDVWQLGMHRLVAGDARSSDDWDPLELPAGATLLTDPPYGMGLDTDFFTQHTATDGIAHDSGRYRPVIGDDEPFDPGPVMGHAMTAWSVREMFWFGADYYRQHLPPGGSWLVWDKRRDDQAFDEVFGAHFELIWCSDRRKRRILRHLWTGHQGLQREDTRTRVHPTQKPVTLLEEMIDLYQPTMLVDPYAGSGSLLIAGENLGVPTRLIELDTTYAGLIIDRWEAHTGRQAERIHP